MPTSMTQARSTLPAHLQRARLATIAKDPAFRRYFASADDSATIRMVLVRLFDSQGKRREQLAIEREARSRRSQQASKRRKERNHSSNSTPERSLWDSMVARERRQERLDRFREEREHDLVRRQRKLDERRNRTAEGKFLRGETDEINYIFRDAEHLVSTLERFVPMMHNGERFVLKFGDKYMTLSLEKYEDILRLVNSWVIRDVIPVGVSDEELVEYIIEKKEITLMRPHARMGGNWTRAQGEFFPYIHSFECEELTKELANLGCWKEVDATNYEDNCLYLAFKSAGVPDSTLEAMKLQFLRRKIARKNVRGIAEEHGLRVTIQTDGDKNLQAYGPKEGFPVRLALIKDHYIHLYKTKFNSFAVLHYDELKDKAEWWTYKSHQRRDKDRGIMSIDLLRTVMKTHHLEPIDITTHGIFRTQFHDKFKGSEFKTLEFPEHYTSLFHAPRDGEGLYLGEAADHDDAVEEEDVGNEEEEDGDLAKAKKAIVKCREKIAKHHCGDATLERLDRKITQLKLGIEEQAKLLRKSIPAEAYYFFDFESSPFDTHKAFCCNFSELDEDDVHSAIGADCAKQFLDAIADKHGKAKQPDDPHFKPPVVKLLAHNITYDLSFLWNHLARLNTVERGTSVVCGSAFYYKFGTELKSGPNKHLAEWMETEGAAIYYAENPARLEHKSVWRKAVAGVRKHTDYIGSHDDFRKIHGIGKEIAKVVKYAPFHKFEPSKEFKLDKVIKIHFQDTYKMIPMPLADFGKSFRLDQSKEIMPYKLYTKKFVQAGGIATLKQLKDVPDFEEHNKLITNLVEWGCGVGNNQFDMIKYANIYCRADVRVLKEGWKVFRNSLMSEYDMDVFAYPTMASLADAYFIEQGCFEGVHKMAGVPRAFIAHASVGGRVMCANNKAVKKTAKLADFDGVSLYPSSMARIPGYLMGPPKVWHSGIDLDAVDGYFVKINVHTVGRRFRFPIVRVKDEDGGNLWTNDLEEKEIIVDRFTLEDLIRHSNITYTVLQGYYFDEGRNNKVNAVIKTMFDMRLRYKKEKNPLQLVIKLMMNSGYGITGLKPIETDVKYVPHDQQVNFIQNHFNHIKWFTKMPNNEWRFELYKQIDTHYNRQHVACEILSVSKNIMNEVMCLAEDIGATIDYTDTDSMHIDFDSVERLGAAFKEKYGRELIGKKLGQFHTDFDFECSYHIVDGKLLRVGNSIESKGEIHACQSIFLGKKSYIDRLQDEEGNEAYHIRLKGIPSKCIQAKCDEAYSGNPMLMFHDLFEGKEVEFDLESGGNCVFKTNKDHSICTGSMTRKVCFGRPDQVLTEDSEEEL